MNLGFPFFRVFHFKDNDTNFGTQLHNLSGDTTVKKFLTIFLPLMDLMDA